MPKVKRHCTMLMERKKEDEEDDTDHSKRLGLHRRHSLRNHGWTMRPCWEMTLSWDERMLSVQSCMCWRHLEAWRAVDAVVEQLAAWLREGSEDSGWGQDFLTSRPRNLLALRPNFQYRNNIEIFPESPDGWRSNGWWQRPGGVSDCSNFGILG